MSRRETAIVTQALFDGHCGKIKYDTQHEASIVCDVMVKKNKRPSRKNIHVTYRCPECKKWHVGRRNQKKLNRTMRLG